jgi:hypothetical protein
MFSKMCSGQRTQYHARAIGGGHNPTSFSSHGPPTGGPATPTGPTPGSTAAGHRHRQTQTLTGFLYTSDLDFGVKKAMT